MKKALPLIMAALVAASLAGCGSSKTEATTAAPAETTTAAQAETTKEETTEAPTEAKAEPITMNVAYMPNYGSLWSVMTAKEKGYFDEEGITVNLVEFADGPTIIAAMESGSIDVGYIGQGAHKLCVNGQAKIFALSHISNGDALIAGPGITKVGCILFRYLQRGHSGEQPDKGRYDHG